MSRDAIIDLIKAQMPELLAIYAFGSRVTGTASPESDLDLAVFVPGQADPEQLWKLSGELADLAGCPVDLLDFRAASSVLQERILRTGERWFALNSQVDAYEAAVLNDKLELDAARAALINDIQREGRVYGR